MDIKELEIMYNETIKNLNELSLDELKDLIKEKRSILSGIEYNITLQKTKGNLSRLIDLQNKFSERWLEDFQDPFWDELRIKKTQKEFQEKIAEFQNLDKYKDYLICQLPTT